MPDFAPTATPRYIASYNSAGITHRIMMRVERDTSESIGVAAARLGLHDFLDELTTSLPEDFAWISANWYDQDSDVAIPVAVPDAVTGLQLLANYSKQDKITHLTFSGKGRFGGKINFKVFGVQFDPDELPAGVENDFVLNPGEAATVDAAVGVLNAVALLRCVDNTKPVIYGRVTLKVNDHWLKQVRSGGI